MTPFRHDFRYDGETVFILGSGRYILSRYVVAYVFDILDPLRVISVGVVRLCSQLLTCVIVGVIETMCLNRQMILEAGVHESKRGRLYGVCAGLGSSQLIVIVRNNGFAGRDNATDTEPFWCLCQTSGMERLGCLWSKQIVPE